MDTDAAGLNTTIALVDDHHLMRSGLVNMINGLEGYRVVLEAANGEELIEALGKVIAPDIAIVDLNMPVMDGYATIAWLRQHTPEVRALALTFDASDEAMLRAVRMGARGFLTKSARPRVLRTALDSIRLTGYYQTDELQKSIAVSDKLRTPEEQNREAVLAHITPREMEFLLLVCAEEEYTYEEIATRMCVTARSLENFRKALFRKFNLKSKTGLVLFAMRLGLIK